jgi:succinyl-CoA synthetase alpha subunit
MSILANEDTRILVQGITGREAATFVSESIQYGAQIIGGVTPGKGGLRVNGVPVFDTVAGALKAAPCNTTIISVPASFVKDAAWEALENGLRLVVIVTENIPRRDVVAVLERASSVGARVVGPNSLGVISPGLTRIGMCGGKAVDVRRAYKPGPVGIISRSGGMMTEIANLLTLNGIGQSTCVSIGGDPIIGTTILDLLPLYEADLQTRALVLFCEPGGTMEEHLSEHLKEYPSRLPILAFVAGRFADRMQGQRFGHAGAIVEGKMGSPTGKMDVLRDAGVHVVDKLSHLPVILHELLGKEL